MIGYSHTPKRKRRLPVSKAEPSNLYLTVGMRPQLSNRSGLCRVSAGFLGTRSDAELASMEKARLSDEGIYPREDQ